MTSAACVLLAAGLVNGIGRVDLYGNLYSFSGGSSTGRQSVDLKLLKDPAIADVVQACAEGCSISSLRAQVPLADEARVRDLVASGLLEVEDGRYRTRLPVIIGRRREQVQQIVASAMPSVVGPLASILGRLEAEGPDPVFLFHLLWSRVLDVTWHDTWDAAFPGTPGPPGVNWVIYPGHSHAVGTNYDQLPGSGSIAVTWSPLASGHIHPLMELRYALQRGAWLGSVPETARAELTSLGLADANGAFRGFSYHSGDRMDHLLRQLAAEYASLAAKLYDYKKLSGALHVPADDLLVIILHETAYEAFRHLDSSGRLPLPRGLRASADLAETRGLVSLRLADPPQPEDEAIALFMRLGGRGNAEAVAAFRKVLESYPTKQKVWMYLGLSLYEIDEYGEALDAFRRLAGLAAAGRDADEVRMRDWAHVWMGHMYDLLNDRERALEQYRAVLDSNSVMQHSQYHIGPISAGEWARERLKSPFARR